MTDSGKQMTFVWHVGNLMGLCEDDFELTKLSCYLAKIYGSKLTMHTGHKHNYLGVNMEFRKDGTLGVYMIPHLKNVIAEFPEIANEVYCFAVVDLLSCITIVRQPCYG
jgi:hypothetical protein